MPLVLSAQCSLTAFEKSKQNRPHKTVARERVMKEGRTPSQNAPVIIITVGPSAPPIIPTDSFFDAPKTPNGTRTHIKSTTALMLNIIAALFFIFITPICVSIITHPPNKVNSSGLYSEYNTALRLKITVISFFKKAVIMSKKLSFTLCALYAGVVIAVWTAFLFLPTKDFSATENRILAQTPELSAGSLLDGSYTKGFSDFCADQFPLRTSLLTLNSSYELGLGKLESNGVMLTQNKNLVKRLEYAELDMLKANLAAIDAIRHQAEGYGVDSVFFCAPRAADVLEHFCPAPFASGEKEWALTEQHNALTATEILKTKAESGEYVFYKTDHHWTTLGAYYAYRELGNSLGYTPYPLSDFEAETVSDSFFGTSYSASLFPVATPDKINAMRYDGDGKITVSDVSTGKKSWLYDTSALKGSSQYDFFLGGNKAHLRIESGGKPRLAVIKDSFANSLIPFLARHYDIDLIDPRYLRQPLAEILISLYEQKEKPTLLLLFGIDTLTGDVGLKKNNKIN